MVVRQYKAKGEVTDLLLPIVALDDAVGLIVFAISFGVAKTLVHGNADLLSVIVEPLAEIILSLGLGAAMGALLTFFERFFHSRSKRLSLSIAFVLMAAGISMLTFEVSGLSFGFSSLLVCMMMGTVFCNMCDFSEELMDRTDRWTAPLFIMFFVLSGAELDLTVLTDAAIVIVGLIYIIFRSGGKYFGSFISAKVTGCSTNVQKYLGIMLLPQEGVALGMSLKAEALGEVGTLVRNIVLFSVLIYELLGPVMTKIALTKAGDIKPGAVSSRGKIG
jgi:Kef-type K+ transport system membrane component KefB